MQTFATNKHRLFLGVLILTVFTLGCEKQTQPTEPAQSDDSKLETFDKLRVNASSGNKQAILDLITSLKTSDGFYTQEICNALGELLVSQSSVTMESIQGLGIDDRGQVLSLCIASEAADLPPNLQEAIDQQKNRFPKLYAELSAALRKHAVKEVK